MRIPIFGRGIFNAGSALFNMDQINLAVMSNKQSCGGLVRHSYEQRTSADVACLHCNNDGDIEDDQPKGTGLAGGAAAGEDCER